MRVFETKAFARFARRQRIDDGVLWVTATREFQLYTPMEGGYLRVTFKRVEDEAEETDLGGGVIEKRLARKEQGKTGVGRSVILFRNSTRAFFVYGFAENDRDDIRRNELLALRKLAEEMLSLDDRALVAVQKNGTFREISPHGETAV